MIDEYAESCEDYRNRRDRDNNFTDEEIEWMKGHASPRLQLNPIWIRAFKFYNNYNHTQLGVECTPCYAKVLNFILKTRAYTTSAQTLLNVRP